MSSYCQQSTIATSALVAVRFLALANHKYLAITTPPRLQPTMHPFIQQLRIPGEHRLLSCPPQCLNPIIISRLWRWLYPHRRTHLDAPLQQHQLLKHRRRA